MDFIMRIIWKFPIIIMNKPLFYLSRKNKKINKFLCKSFKNEMNRRVGYLSNNIDLDTKDIKYKDIK